MFLNHAFLTGRSGASRIKFTTAALLLLVAAVFGVSAQDDSGNTLVVGTNAPVVLDPAIGTADSEILLNRAIYDYLVDVAPDGTLEPALATDWTVSDDGLTYTLNLREGVTFHDGSSFDAQDVLFTFNRLAEIGSPALNLLGDFDIEAPDDSTVVFTIPSPNADFMFGVASRWSLILPDGAEDINVFSEADNRYANFNGTGPFILTDYRDGESATLQANPDYWQEGEPQLDELVISFIEEMDAQINAVLSGEVDFIFKVPFDRLEELEAEESLEATVIAASQHPVVRLRVDEGRLGEDVRVRQAFKLATDRELLNIDLFDGQATVGNNDPIAPSFGQFYTPVEQEYNPERACELLAEAGYPEGLGADEPIPFYVVDAFNYEEMAINLQDQWAQGCIFVEILMRAENIYYGNNEWLDVDLGVTGWSDRPTPQLFFLEAYTTSALPENGGFNESRFSDPDVDALVEQAGETAEPEARAALFAEISRIFADRGPIIVPFFAPIVGIYSSDVEGLEMHPFPGRTDFSGVSIGG